MSHSKSSSLILEGGSEQSGVGQSSPGAEGIPLISVYLTASERLLTGLTEILIFLLTRSFKRLCYLGF